MKPLTLVPCLPWAFGLTRHPPCQAQAKKPAKLGISVQGRGNAFFAQIQRLKAAEITALAVAAEGGVGPGRHVRPPARGRRRAGLQGVDQAVGVGRLRSGAPRSKPHVFTITSTRKPT